MNKTVVLAVLVGVMCSAGVVAQDADYRIAYYITGWGTVPPGRSTDNAWYPQLTPLIGGYTSDDPRVAEEHIRMAVAHGVNAFAIPSSRPTAGWGWEAFFEQGLLQAKNLSSIRFCMMFNNEPWWDNPNLGDITWQDLTSETVQYFAQEYFPHEQYLCVDERPVVILYHAFIFRDRFGLSSLRQIVADIREIGLRNGFDIYLIGDMMNTGRSDSGIELFDAICSYAMPEAGPGWAHPDGIPTVDAPYSSMVAAYCQLNQYYESLTQQAGIGFVPTAITGFDNSNMVAQGVDPWSVTRTDSSPAQYEQMLECVYAVDSEPHMVILGAWNEIHEGWVLEPTVEDGFGYLEAVRTVFGEGLPDTPYSSTFLEQRTTQETTAESSRSIDSLAISCSSLPLSDIFWHASYDDESPRTESNFAEIIEGSDEYGEYYGMEWSSPEDTDLTIGELDQFDLSGVTAIKLTLSATERMTVLPYAGLSGEYCGKMGRYAVADPIIVGPDCQVYEFAVPGFGEEDPLRGCSGRLSEDALESLYSMVLFPDDRSGELRVYDVQVCGETVAVVEDEPEDEPAAPEIPAFAIDSDVTLDSVVQIGDGPQDLSTDIKFYPNTRRAKPGDTVYWTLEIGEGSGLEPPFTIVPEMDNDGYREDTIRSSNSNVVIARTYETANIYVPFLTVTDGEGKKYEIHSCSVLGVLPDLAQRQGLEITLPSLDGTPGDYLKGMNVYAFDYTLFGTANGEKFIQGELDRVAGLGVNLMIYNVGWVFEDSTDSLHEPVYGAAGERDACCGWVSTLSIDALVELADWSHERGMRAAIRYFLWRKCYSSIGRETFDPASIELYMEQQTQIKLLYAELCQSLGIEVFFLDAENEVFTREPRVKQLVRDIRGVYDGVLAGGAYSVDHLYACPFAGDLDLLAWSDYYFFTNGMSEDATTEQFRNAFLFHYSDDIAPVLDLFQKPGLIVETGVNIRETPSDSVERQYQGYLEALERLQREGAPVIGNGWWVWNLSDPPIEPHVMRGSAAESIVGEYFGSILSDRLSVHSSEGEQDAPSIDLVLRDFEGELPRYLISSQGSSIIPSIVGGSVLGDHCLRLDLVPSSNPDYRHGFILEEHTPPLNWSGFSSLNFWLRSSNENWGLEVTLYDADGDRFNTRVNTKPLLAELLPESDGWRLVSIPLELFTKPTWDTGGNGSMDWRRVKDWGVGLFYKDQGAQVLWLDSFYLSTEGGLL